MKYKVSKNLTDLIVVKSSGFLSTDSLNNLFSTIEKEAARHYFTIASEANLIRIISSILDPIAFLIGCSKYPHYVESVIAVAANSNYLTDILVRNPEFIYLITDSFYLNKIDSQESLEKEIEGKFLRYKSFNSKVKFLRLLKRRTMLKIGLNDILGSRKFDQIILDISALANAILNKLFELCYREVLEAHGIANTRRSYSLCSLGKLGGNELNYSSDVDLIIFYDKNGKIGKQKLEYFELLQEAVLLFIKVGSDITDAGFMFRIDFRLRPDGRNAPLCRTITDYLRYYESRGEDWERQMLIKLNFVSGSKSLYNDFRNYISGFIYPSSFSTSPLNQIKKMKSNIEKRDGVDDNIKLFSGGIRDIEFATQALQLLNGGKNKSLRTATTLIALSELEKSGLLKPSEVKTFTNAYIFYRRIEHYLQLMNDQQTHILPKDKDMLNKIAKFVNLKNDRELLKSISKNRLRVRRLFNDIIEPDLVSSTDLSSIKFTNLSRAEANLKYLNTGMGLLGQKEFDSKTIDLFSRLEDKLLAHLGICPQPDRVLDNFTNIIKATGYPKIWYQEFLDDQFFNDFLTLCEYSRYAVEMLINKKSLSEILITRRYFVKDIESSFANIDITAVLFILAVQFSLKLIDHSKISSTLANYINKQIEICLSNYEIPTNYFVAGLGSFGVQELSFGSDIDLVFVVEKIEDSQLIQTTFQNVLASIQKQLKVFEIDCRLRPEGKKSQLVWEIDSYVKYVQTRARVWEFQALMKMGFSACDKKLFTKFKNRICNAIAKTDKEIIKFEITSMLQKIHSSGIQFGKPRFNLKKSSGSLIDIDFLISYLSLNSKENIKACIGKLFTDKLKNCSNKISSKEINELTRAFNFYKNLSSLLKTATSSGKNFIPTDLNELLIITSYFNFADINQLNTEIITTSKRIAELVKKYLK